MSIIRNILTKNETYSYEQLKERWNKLDNASLLYKLANQKDYKLLQNIFANNNPENVFNVLSNNDGSINKHDLLKYTTLGDNNIDNISKKDVQELLKMANIPIGFATDVEVNTHTYLSKKEKKELVQQSVDNAIEKILNSNMPELEDYKAYLKSNKSQILVSKFKKKLFSSSVTLGDFDHTNKKIRISAYNFINPADEKAVCTTLLHEIGHALIDNKYNSQFEEKTVEKKAQMIANKIYPNKAMNEKQIIKYLENDFLNQSCYKKSPDFAPGDGSLPKEFRVPLNKENFINPLNGEKLYKDIDKISKLGTLKNNVYSITYFEKTSNPKEAIKVSTSITYDKTGKPVAMTETLTILEQDKNNEIKQGYSFDIQYKYTNGKFTKTSD